MSGLKSRFSSFKVAPSTCATLFGVLAFKGSRRVCGLGRDQRNRTERGANESFGESCADGEEQSVVGGGRMGAGCGLAGCAGTAGCGGIARRYGGEHGRGGEGGGRFFPVLQRGVAC